MKNKSKVLGIVTAIAFMSIAFAPGVFAVECDADADGYVALTQDMLEEVVADNTFKTNGNYAPEQWQNIFQTYKNKIAADSGLNERYSCDSLNFKKGAEASRCDAITLTPESGVYDTAKVSALAGNRVNPSTFDTPNNGIDEDCDGADGKFISSSGGDKDLGNLVQKSITLLGRAVAVISIAVLIWGGILYATAAGDEQKTSKARKAILGAIIGLIVGLLAPSVVNWITSSLA